MIVPLRYLFVMITFILTVQIRSKHHTTCVINILILKINIMDKTGRQTTITHGTVYLVGKGSVNMLSIRENM